MGLSDGLSLDNSILGTKNVMPLPISHRSIGQSVDIKFVKPTMDVYDLQKMLVFNRVPVMKMRDFENNWGLECLWCILFVCLQCTCVS